MKKQYSSSWYSRSRSSSMPRQAVLPEEPSQAGCMGGMMHYLLFAPGAGCVGRPPPDSAAAAHPDPANLYLTSSCYDKGLEAPRNSLELDGDDLKDIPIGVQIEPAFDSLARSAMRRKATAPSSEAETPRTPSLVARLMGIDGLPEQSTPSPVLKKPAKPRGDKANKKEEGVVVKEKKKRVIPESMKNEPRQPLRSLSSNVPAAAACEARSLPDTPRASTSSARASYWDVVDHPRMSLQILKENVDVRYMSLPTSPTSSSCGAKKKEAGHRRRDERSTKEHAREIVRQAKETVSNRKSKKAMRGALVETTNYSPSSPKTQPELHIPKQPPPAKPSRQPTQPPPPPPPDLPRPAPPAVKCKKPDGCERFATRIKKPAIPQSSPQPAPPPPAPANSTGSSSIIKCVLPLERDPGYSYVRKVLDRGGFMRTASRPFKGHSISAPVDPIIFHLLELELPVDERRLGTLSYRWNRKLLFHLVQEILVDLLCSELFPNGPPLLQKLWGKIQSFPAADCKVLGDIDTLVAMDLQAASVRRLVVAEEAGDVADDVADRVLDDLLGDTAAESLSLSSWWWPSRAPR